MAADTYVPRADILVVTDTSRTRWFVHRAPWAPVAEEREWLYERRALSRSRG